MEAIKTKEAREVNKVDDMRYYIYPMGVKKRRMPGCQVSSLDQSEQRFGFISMHALIRNPYEKF